MERVLAEYGKIDILVNNAGVSLFEAKSATDADFDAFDAVMETNVTASAMLAHRVGKEMLARGYGRIINLSSVLGVVGGVPQGPSWAYSISKHSVVGTDTGLRYPVGRPWGDCERPGARVLPQRAVVCRGEPGCGGDKIPDADAEAGEARGVKDGLAFSCIKEFEFHHGADYSSGRRLERLVGGQARTPGVGGIGSGRWAVLEAGQHLFGEEG